MKKYIVIALSCGGANNKIYHAGDEVDEACFPPGHVPELVKGGFLEEIKSEPEEVYTSPDKPLEEDKPKNKKKGGATGPDKE